MRLLLIEDQRRLAENIKGGLVESGFAVDLAFDGEEGQHLAETESYDCIILDLMLPKVNVLTVCKNLRSQEIKTPILMLTAKTQIEDRVLGLDSGADDYLTKPFAFEELKASVHALIRRAHQQPQAILTIADLVLDPQKRLVKRAHKTISLTPKEFAILELLMRHPDSVVTRTQIIDHVWDYNYDSLSNLIDVFIASLRKKIDKGFSPPLIHTLHGVGFKISVTK